ncbi:pantoate--beta-alanine ligase, partial [uncultured Duncaniella sp.]|uniref:pantoate--beta-alanine ligase n=1 Tax=uncultured Duncaniella sp. TaxID=2768039 RepID=UPI0025A5390A
PTQFNNPNDLATYPRTEEADTAMLCEAGVDYAFIPSVEEIYADQPKADEYAYHYGVVLTTGAFN